VSVPDGIEPVVGWRCWRVMDSADGLVLASACRPTRWAPGWPLEASCDAGHRAPRSSCTCGIYAALEPRLPHRYLPPHVRAAERIRTQAILGYDVVMAVGLVALWGGVIECEWGWRAELGYPRRLFVPTGVRHFRRTRRGVDSFDSLRLAAELEALYGVSTRVTPSVRPEALLALAGTS
jgi:hypothetical protein